MIRGKPRPSVFKATERTRSASGIFIYTFIPFLFILAVILFAAFRIEIDADNRSSRQVEVRNTDHARFIVSEILGQTYSDLLILSRQPELHHYLDGTQPGLDTGNKADLLLDVQRSFLKFASSKTTYDQVRFLDDTGREIVRINYNDGQPVVVADQDLQFKGDRYYFIDTFKLAPDEIYVSPFDLNYEYSRLEMPVKPMIRIASPVADSYGNKRGIIILNYLGHFLIDSLDQGGESNGSHYMLLNRDGYWLKGGAAWKEWGFMFDDSQSDRMDYLFPDEWIAICREDAGQMATHNGLFTFATVYPLLEGMKSSTGSGKPFEPSREQLNSQEYAWKIVSYVPAYVISARSAPLKGRILMLFSVLAVVLAVLSWVYTRSSIKRLEANDELLRQREFLCKVVDSLTHSFLVVDCRDYSVPLANQAALNAGHADSSTCHGLHFNKDGPCQHVSTCPIEMVKASGKPISIEQVHSTNGSRRVLEVHGYPLHDENGEISQIIEYCLDITDRKNYEDALRKSEELYRSLFHRVPAGLFTLAVDGRVIDVNLTAIQILGCSESDTVIGSHLADCFTTKANQETIATTIDTSGNMLNHEYLLKRLDGRELWVELSLIPHRGQSGDTEFFEGMLIDINERKSAILSLGQRTQELAERVKELNYLFNLSKLLAEPGISNDELFKTLVDTLPMAWNDPQDISALIDYKGRRYTSNDYRESVNVRTEDINVHGKAKGAVTIHFHDTRDSVTEGSLNTEKAGLLSTVCDEISRFLESKDAEQQVRQMQKMEAIGTLAGGIAHDFNNILTAIQGFAELVKGELEFNEMELNDIDEVLKASSRARDLVAQILAFSRRSETPRIKIQLSSIVKEAVKLMRASIPSSIAIKQHIECVEGLVTADPTHVHQIIMNLCTNAAHAMNDAGGTLDIGLREIHIDSGFSDQGLKLSPGDYLLLTVADTGKGIPADIQEFIFEPYFTTKPAGEGTGLGLAVVHGIVTDLGGMVSVYSQPGKGTRFNVYLPKSTGELKMTSQIEKIELHGTERILAVDDEPQLVWLLNRGLSRFGYQVVAETDSRKALKRFIDDPEAVDIVITDLTMPGISGIELAREISDIRPDLPIILVTGFGQTMTDSLIKETGIDKVVLKPVEIRKLIAVMRRLLSGKQNTMVMAE